MAEPPEEKPPLTSRLLRAGRVFIAHPLGQFVIFITFLYQVKECYPFTHIPMYSDPEANAPYLYLADGEGAPLGVKSHGGITNPKMRKMYRARLDRYCREHGLDKNAPPKQAIDVIGGEVIAFLRKHAEERNNPLPPTVRLMHVVIEPDAPPAGFKETTTLLLEDTSPGGSP